VEEEFHAFISLALDIGRAKKAQSP